MVLVGEVTLIIRYTLFQNAVGKMRLLVLVLAGCLNVLEITRCQELSVIRHSDGDIFTLEGKSDDYKSSRELTLHRVAVSRNVNHRGSSFGIPSISCASVSVSRASREAEEGGKGDEIANRAIVTRCFSREITHTGLRVGKKKEKKRRAEDFARGRRYAKGTVEKLAPAD